MKKNGQSQTFGAEASDSNRDRWVIGMLVFVAIVFVGIASRFWLVEMPNFKPVAALVLFAGFFFRKSWPAIAALMLIMVVSDLMLGFYQWTLMASVYGSLGLACCLGVWVKRSGKLRSGKLRNGTAGNSRIGLRHAWRFVAASLVMSTTFYLLTNGAVWWGGAWYSSSWRGLFDCYIAGLPFYRATLMGDLIFTGATVGVCAAVQGLAYQLRGCTSPSVGGLSKIN